MKSALPKVLHTLAGKPMLGHVLDACKGAGVERTLVVVGHGRQAVEAWLDGRAEIVHQTEQLGTGHAVMTAERLLAGQTGPVLVMAGDTPMVTAETIRRVVESAEAAHAGAVILTSKMDDPRGYGRIVRDGGGAVIKIIEEKDATPEEREVAEVNTGTYCFDGGSLFSALSSIENNNQQGEYYLTDVISVLRESGKTILPVEAPPEETMGVNSREDLARADGAMQARLRTRFMAEGVTFILPETTYLEAEIEIGRDTVILPQSYLEAGTKIGAGAKIGPGTKIGASKIGDGADIQYSVLRECEVRENALVGPFSLIRPGTVIGVNAKAGAFVEVKNSTIGPGSKVPHLSYIGDTEIGSNVNVGAGSITCNYDGASKHKTVIGDGAFIGSDTMFIAPVEIGKGAATGAGSSISHDVPPDSLAVERSEQRTIPGWAKRRREKKR